MSSPRHSQLPNRPLSDMAIRCLDLGAAAVGLMLLTPVFLLLACCIRWDSNGPAFFCQTRVGRHFRPFQLYKFRTMVQRADTMGSGLTVGQDSRITAVGRVLRTLRIDELPQLLNVLKGDMSLVGPRPELPKFVDLFRCEYETLLSVRPGITDPASIAFRNEAELLAGHDDHEQVYVTSILPQKIQLSLRYLERRSVVMNLKVIWQTLRAVCMPTPPIRHNAAPHINSQGSTHVS